MFSKILVANRGEISVRVIRTCREMGIKTVAVYSEVDQAALHVRLADEAVKAPGVRGYLDIDFMVSAALKTGAEAIHPGYGFLAENPQFAVACREAGLVFIGPEAQAMERMGDKARARESMLAAGVPVTPGTQGVLESEEEAFRVARRIGFPVLVKAVAGGAGRGMRLARQEGELGAALAAARSEALASFGNPQLYLEKYLGGCRHIEVQILADNYGNAVHLGERECSIQRRNQKLLEESPSPAVDVTLREQLGRVAVTAAKAVGYQGAGTIEFLLDKNRNFHFMEMNTRIQVEHPVTELVSGLDMVREQIRIAAGEPLGYSQADIRLNGWAMECRVNAEDPVTFLPSPGEITFCRLPGGFGVRVDTAVFGGETVSPFYDSLIAKVLVHAGTRNQALGRMRRALEEFEVRGVKTTIPFHLKILLHPDFQNGEFDTGFIAGKMTENTDNAVSPAGMNPEVVAAISAALRMYGVNSGEGWVLRKIRPTGRNCSSWRLAGLYERMGGI
ncbi:Biotin carboxylase [Acididesulfobacillus acetoxydans]|uniref:Biotin carboxylase n=1 Tax=Acididesulfobacillus acetoxydans TaxID=1561005 RepID=A0A8S0WGD9_9FIRM|nr:acetyl-CoA carboxylase biotin carboxylase subunit [Acididesulfobacillus acetoxydans]CAA7601812.1 Biotin carboxylase [Acididesulfobacillus acetoxydans]CEJ09232.1 Biotin carboxylase 1 [Acididesulfobacillus acetoxydans]